MRKKDRGREKERGKEREIDDDKKAGGDKVINRLGAGNLHVPTAAPSETVLNYLPTFTEIP